MITTTTTTTTTANATPANGWTFTRDSLSINGCTCPATYSPSKDGTLYIFTGLMYPGADKATPVRLTLKPDMGELYALAMAASTTPAEPEEAPAPVAEAEPVPAVTPDSVKVPEGYAPVVADGVIVAVEQHIDLTAETPAAPAEPVEEEKPAPVKPKRAPRKRSGPRPLEPKAAPAEPVKAETPAAPVEAAPVETPAPAAEPAPAEAAPVVKPWLGTSISGKGWTISFDEQVGRTCVRFEGEPSAAQKAAVESAAFYFRRDLGCWVKKLTCKAHRAALTLADVLKALD